MLVNSGSGQSNCNLREIECFSLGILFFFQRLYCPVVFFFVVWGLVFIFALSAMMLPFFKIQFVSVVC